MLGTGMNVRKLGTICALLAATSNLIDCESSRDSPDRQFQKQVKRAQECRQLQDKLVGDQPLTPERAEEIAKTMDRTRMYRPAPRPLMLVFTTRALPIKESACADSGRCLVRSDWLKSKNSACAGGEAGGGGRLGK
jgi:hypothetical protein